MLDYVDLLIDIEDLVKITVSNLGVLQEDVTTQDGDMKIIGDVSKYM
jgi:hypothetical protein